MPKLIVFHFSQFSIKNYHFFMKYQHNKRRIIIIFQKCNVFLWIQLTMKNVKWLFHQIIDSLRMKKGKLLHKIILRILIKLKPPKHEWKALRCLSLALSSLFMQTQIPTLHFSSHHPSVVVGVLKEKCFYDRRST